jgi:galactonate dehydratase
LRRDLGACHDDDRGLKWSTQMRITDMEIIRIRVNHRGDWLFVRLLTDTGISGIGEASHGGFSPQRDDIVATILTTQCLPVLRGSDPCAVAAAADALQSLVDGLASATAVSACEQALWDIAG